MLRAFATHLRRNAVLYVLLFVMLGGTAYAAGKVKSSNLGKTKVRQSDAVVANGKSVSHTTKCRPDERALGGGVKWSGDATTGKLVIVQAFPTPVKNPTKFTAVGSVQSGGSRTLVVEVTCLQK